MMVAVKAALLGRPVQQGTNYHGIDALRGIAAFAVLLFHYHRFFFGLPLIAPPVESVAAFAPYQHANWAFSLGGEAVLLFWSISGFVFLHVYGTQRRAPTGRTFFVNRFARLYPLHFITLLVVAAIQILAMQLFGRSIIYQANDLYNFGLNLFFASEWGFSHGRSFNGPIWSVSIEVLIYAVFYLYIRRFPVNPLSIAGMLLLGLIAVALTGGQNLIALCAVYFFAGALAYGLFALLPRTGAVTMGITLALLLGIGGIMLIGVLGLSLPMTLWLPPLFMLALMLIAQIEACGGAGPFRRLQWLGDMTYSSYLWHTPIQMVLMMLAGLGIIAPPLFLEGWFLLVFLGLVLLVSAGSFRWIERPAQRLLRRRLLPPHAPRGPQVAP